LVKTDALDLEDMKPRDRIDNGNVWRTRTAAHNGGFTEKDRTDPIEGLGED
jgi:hypothetical protein